MGPGSRHGSDGSDDGIVGVELRFASMRQVQAEFVSYLSTEGVFIPHPEPYPPSTVVRFAVVLPDGFRLLEGVGVVLWNRREEGGPGQPAGMALHFASLGPRSQELINSLVAAMVEEGGRPFDLDLGSEEEGFIPTDALAGRISPPDWRSVATQRARAFGDELPQLRVRGAEGDGARPGSPAESRQTPAEDPVLEPAVFAAATSEPEAVVVELPPVPDAEEPEPWPEAGEARDTVAGERSGSTDGGVDLPDGAPPREDSWDTPTSNLMGTETGDGETGSEPVSGPGWREVPRHGAVEDNADDAVRGDNRVAAAELVAEVIASQEGNPLDRGGEGGADAGPDGALDSFVDSLRTLNGRSPSPSVSSMPEVTIVPREEDEAEPPGRTMPWVALAAVAALLAVAAVGYFGRERLASLLVPEAREVGVDAVDRAGVEPGDAQPVAVGTPDREVDLQAATPPQPEPTAVVVPTATSVPAAMPAEPTTARPEPTETPVPVPPPSSPAGRVVDIRWSADVGRTVVTIVADGGLTEERVRVSTMSGPPRVLVRILRVDRFARYELAVGTPEVEKIRVGHHPDQSPPSLHVVLDLTGPAVALESTEVAGAEVRLTLSG